MKDQLIRDPLDRIHQLTSQFVDASVRGYHLGNSVDSCLHPVMVEVVIGRGTAVHNVLADSKGQIGL